MPNVDRLYKEGVVFENHYCTSPVCSPARYTLITGQYPHTHGQWDNYGRWIPEDSPVLMQHLAANGYETAGIGKMHFNLPEKLQMSDLLQHHIEIEGWVHGGTDEYDKFLQKHNLSRRDYMKLQDQGAPYGAFDWPFADRFHVDHYIAERAVEFIESRQANAP